jgi:mannose-6-phosphate isomerase-like protein (cupin superfamily)
LRAGEIMRVAVILVAAAAIAPGAPPLAQRIGHSDSAKYFRVVHGHGGAGEQRLTDLMEGVPFTTNLRWLHKGWLLPMGGIGNHFHHGLEDMFIIFDGEAEYTVDGRTAKLAAIAGAPCRMGHSHAIYNPTDKPVEFMNIVVSMVKGKADAFDLGDDRVGAPIEPKPVFIHVRMDKERLAPVANMNGGQGTARYRRLLGPEIFTTNWAYFDHVLLPRGASIGKHRHAGLEEIYYVLSGAGSATVGAESEPVRRGDAVPVLLTNGGGEVHAIGNTGAADLELMVIGIALEKAKLDSTDVK